MVRNPEARGTSRAADFEGGGARRKLCAHGLIVLLSAVCLSSIASAQTTWWRTYGGRENDLGYSVRQTTDGGYIIAGSTSSFTPTFSNVYLVKTDSRGDTLWTRTFGGTNNDEGWSVRQTNDGGYIVAGWTVPLSADNTDVYLVKTSAQGDTLWSRTYGGTSNDVSFSVQQTSDGGYIVAGTTGSFGAGNGDAYLIKTDAAGDTLWTRTYGDTSGEEGQFVQQTTDSGYIIAGRTSSFGAGRADVWLIKTNAQGETLWTGAYGGTGNDFVSSVQQTTDGGYVISGYTLSFGAGNLDVYLVKTDYQGDTLWTRTFGGTYSDGGYSVQQTTDGGYVVAGFTQSFGAGSFDVYLIKTNASGDTFWTRTYGQLSSDGGYSVQQTADGACVVAGITQSFGAGGFDVYLIKTDSLGNIAGIEEPLTRRPASPTRFLVQPNPFASFARVPGHETDVFVLSDVTGRQVAVCKGDRIGAGLRPGVYFMSPVGSRAGNAATTTIVKTAF